MPISAPASIPPKPVRAAAPRAAAIGATIGRTETMGEKGELSPDAPANRLSRNPDAPLPPPRNEVAALGSRLAEERVLNSAAIGPESAPPGRRAMSEPRE